MSLASLDQAISNLITPEQQVKIHVGKIFKLTEFDYKKHPYWGKFFNKYPSESIVKIKELLEYPDLKSPEWIVMYGSTNSPSFKRERDDKIILVCCSFGLMDVGKEGKRHLVRPDYLYLEVI